MVKLLRNSVNICRNTLDDSNGLSLMGQRTVPIFLEQVTPMRRPLYLPIGDLPAGREFIRRWRRCVHALLLFVVALSSFGSSAAWSAEARAANFAARSLANITLQPKWMPQCQFTVLDAAQAKGFYQQQGLNVTIVPGSVATSPLATLLAGNVQFSVGDSDLLMARFQCQPIVAPR